MTSSLKILTIIPARGGSKGVPKKNIRLVGNKPLIAYTIEVALRSEVLDRIIVSTDSEEIAEISKRLGAEIPFIRPKGLSIDSAPTLPVIQHAVKSIESNDLVTFDWILILQPTNPFKSTEDIGNAIKIAEETSCDSIISVVQVFAHHPILMKKIKDNRLLDFSFKEKEGTRRQDYSPPAYMRNGAIYLTRREVIMEDNSIWGKSIHPYIMPESRSFNIDSEIDLEVAHNILSSNNR